ncbi:MAG: hypothetical protein H7Y33_01010 [Cytophagales bacterium]|nr:hypothetical protein [Rhizobacter sp.]
MSWTLISNWRTLHGVHRKRPDPFVIWAALTGWRDYSTIPPSPYLFVILELAGDRTALKKFRCRADEKDSGILIPVDYPETARYVTARVTYEGLNDLVVKADLQSSIERLDLSEAVRSGRPEGFLNQWREKPLRPTLRGEVILGVVDDGCPFAHALFSPAVATGVFPREAIDSTRIAAMWDQNLSDQTEATKAYGHESAGFGYGREIFRDYAGARGSRAVLLGFADVLRARLSKQAVEEDVLYDDVGVPSMRRRVVHGPHITDIFAGPVRVRERVFLDRDTPPTWQPANDVASDAKRSDIVFVQLPREGLQDSSGGWLDSHILDAVTYIDRCRRDDAHRAVINVSYGNTMGPHDASSILDKALEALIGESKGAVQVVIAAGNSFSSHGHAEFDVPATKKVELTWRIPPGSETPHFVQVWLPQGLTEQECEKVKISVQVPTTNGPTGTVKINEVMAWPSAQQPQAVISFLAKPSRGEDSAMAFIAVSPTAVVGEGEDRSAPHGDWCISIEADIELKHVHAYIARNDRDLGAALRGRQSYFVDEIDERDRFLRTPLDDDGRNANDTDLFGQARAGAQVKRRGTQNGISTAEGVSAVAGYSRLFSREPQEGAHAPYSSAGWKVAGDKRQSKLAAAMPSDESGVLKGVRAAGSRSGSTFRLVGTSVAAPQYARALADVSAKTPPDPPNQTKPPEDDPELYGEGGRKQIVITNV